MILVRSVLTLSLLVALLVLLPALAKAQDPAIWTQYWDLQSQISHSSKTPDGADTELADDFNLGGSITAIGADGTHFYYFNSPPMNLQAAYVRFYDGQGGTPGALQYEQLIPANAITVTGSGGDFHLRITLPEPFVASGRHFVSVQTVSDLTWSWRTANRTNFVLAPAQRRDRTTGAPWTNAAQTDVAFVLYGTLTSPPTLSSIEEPEAPRSGRIRLSGTSFGSTQGTSEVRIGGVKAIVTRWNNTRIHAYVPETIAPGEQPVQVMNGNGSSNALPLTVTPRVSPGGQVLWRFRADSSGASASVVSPDGTIYVMDDHGNLYALSPDGGLLWATKSGFQGSRLARGLDGTLYTMADGVVQATNPDGSPKWTFTHPQLNWTISGPSVGPDGNIYATAQNTGFGFFSLTPEGGLRWANPYVLDRIPRGHEIVFSEGQAYVNHQRNDMPNLELMAFRMSDGEFQWIREADNGSQPLIGPNGRIYVDWLMGTWRTLIYNPDGGVHFSRPGLIGLRRFSPDRSKLYANTPGGQTISALDSETFELLWTAEVGVSLTAPPTPDPLDRYIIAPTHQPGSPGNVFAFRSSGHLLWREDFPVEADKTFTPAGGPSFSSDGEAFYIGTYALTYDQTNQYCYVYAFQTDPASPLLAPVSIGAASRKTHDNVGTFDIELPFSGAPGIESRSPGANGAHQVVVSFATPISLTGAAITDGAGSVSSYSVNGNRVVINLTGIPNATLTTLTLNSVNDGAVAGPVSIRLATLLGDTNASGSVTATDVGQTKGQASRPVGPDNFRNDVTANGAINASDVGVVKAQSGSALAAGQEKSSSR